MQICLGQKTLGIAIAINCRFLTAMIEIQQPIPTNSFVSGRGQLAGLARFGYPGYSAEV
jgi:hypothetical protein